MELRSPDPSTNPYLAFALVISAGFFGIENNLALTEKLDADLYNADKSITDSLARLPENLEEALYLAEKSDFIKTTLNEELLSQFIYLKTLELEDYRRASNSSDYFFNNYFRVI